MKNPIQLLMPLVLSTVLSTAALAHQHDPYKDVKVTATEVAPGLYMVVGAGGNLAVMVGKDGTFLVDDQYAPLTAKIMAAIEGVGGSTPKFLINTHWHGDHTGGNENFGKAGSVIVAHQNVRKRMSTEQFVAAFNMKSPPAPEVALPVITFADGVTFHWNDDELQVVHVPNAHTDTDSYIHFKKANVIHTGDLYFAGMYPFIDPDSGGAIAGVIAAVDKLLALADSTTKVIPGHGPLSNKKELGEYREMLSTVYQRIKKMKDGGKTEQQVVDARPTADFDEKWGGGFLKADQWVGIIYQGIE